MSARVFAIAVLIRVSVGSTADVSFVLAVQTLRLFVVLITGPILARWIARAAPGGR